VTSELWQEAQAHLNHDTSILDIGYLDIVGAVHHSGRHVYKSVALHWEVCFSGRMGFEVRVVEDLQVKVERMRGEKFMKRWNEPRLQAA
jgi:hypothetical protein